MQLVKVLNGFEVHAREADHYVSATELCKAASKQWNDYWRNKGTVAFLDALASETGIPVSQLVEVRKGNSRGQKQGTWIHPQVVAHFAQWASPQFAVAVSGWVVELLTTGKVELKPEEADRLAPVSETLHALASNQAAVADRLASLERALVTLTTPASRPLLTSAGSVWTVDMRIDERYPMWATTAKQRASIRARANKHITLACPGSEVLRFNRDCAYDRTQVYFLDLAIDREYRRAMADHRQTQPGLFSEAA